MVLGATVLPALDPKIRNDQGLWTDILSDACNACCSLMCPTHDPMCRQGSRDGAGPAAVTYTSPCACWCAARLAWFGCILISSSCPSISRLSFQSWTSSIVLYSIGLSLSVVPRTFPLRWAVSGWASSIEHHYAEPWCFRLCPCWTPSYTP